MRCEPLFIAGDTILFWLNGGVEFNVTSDEFMVELVKLDATDPLKSAALIASLWAKGECPAALLVNELPFIGGPYCIPVEEGGCIEAIELIPLGGIPIIGGTGALTLVYGGATVENEELFACPISFVSH
jgi:hypothetical protein